MSVDLDGDPEKGGLIIFLVLLILGGHVGMILILSTIVLSRQIMRHAIFVNFCITWMLYSLSYALLFYAGQVDNMEPSFPLCMTQAAMSYGSAPMTSVSSLIFITHIFLALRCAVFQHPPMKWQKLRLYTMLATPYLVYLAVFTAVIIAGNIEPDKVQRGTFYCYIELRSIASLAPGVSALAVIAAIVIQSLIGVTLYRRWRQFRALKASTGLSLPLMARALVFTVWAILALLVCIAFLAHYKPTAADIAFASLPMGAFLLFGTQSDLLRVWHIRRDVAKNPHALDSFPSIAHPPTTV